jgi:hypothetical protein
MKRGKTVINARLSKAGRRSLRWVASGCNWAPGESRDALRAQALGLLAEGPAFHQRFAALVCSVCDDQGTIGQTFVAALVRACAGDRGVAPHWRQVANQRDEDRPIGAGWTYDTETVSYIRLAEACENGQMLADAGY